jgi:hypothetical protein
MHPQERLLFMQTSKTFPDHWAVLTVLLIINCLLYLSWFWLRSLPLGSDSSDPFIVGTTINKEALFRNDDYLAAFLDRIHHEKRILLLGTSESNTFHNLGHQLNNMVPLNPQIYTVASGGMSPIHSCLAIAKSRREGLRLPPMVMMINLIYFTSSHDVINDGWLSRVIRSPVFLEMNHRNINDFLSKDVKNAYNKHFAYKQALFPFSMQEYLGNLLYLASHQVAIKQGPWKNALIPAYKYKFDGTIPEYDEKRSVWKGYHASDQIAKSRWEVSMEKNSLNLKGLLNIINIVSEQPAPILFIILPTNRNFYQFNGLDMDEYDMRYKDIRSKIRATIKNDNIYLLDLYNAPQLHLGFTDRMHLDKFGYYQLGKHIIKAPEYISFIRAVWEYYAE